MNSVSSFTVYTAALHALILIMFYLLIPGLGYPGLVVFQQIKHFTHHKTSSRKPYTSSKQQERHKHSVEITIKLSGSKPYSMHKVSQCDKSELCAVFH